MEPTPIEYGGALPDGKSFGVAVAISAIKKGRDVPNTWISQLPRIVDILPNVLDRLPIGIHIEDSSLRSVYINDEFTNIFGYSIEDIAFADIWWPLVYPDEAYRQTVQREWFAAVALAKDKNTEIVPHEWRVTCRDGSQKIVQFHCRAVGEYYVHAYVDVTTRHKLDAELRDLANTDPLTGVANRRHFFSFAEKHLDSGTPSSVLLIDIDHFKSVNDRFGHAGGDNVLIAIATLCKAVLAEAGILARWGGEEFAVFLPGYGRDNAPGIAEEMRARITATSIPVNEKPLKISVSIGGTCRLGEETGIDAMLLRADHALYSAKAAGRNCVRFE